MVASTVLVWSLVVSSVTIKTAQSQVVCSDLIQENCIFQEESILTPEDIVTEGTDLTFTLKTKGRLTSQLTLSFPTINEDEKYCFFQPDKWEDGENECGSILVKDDLVPKVNRTCSCNFKEHQNNIFDYVITFKNATQYESGVFIMKNILLGEGGIPFPRDYPLMVAVPPRSIYIEGAEDEMEYRPGVERKQTMSCYAEYTRPAPEYHWTLEGNSLEDVEFSTNNQTVEEFPGNYFFPGTGFIARQSFELTVLPGLDGKTLSCKVEHMGYEAGFPDLNKTATVTLTVRGPPVPVNETLEIDGEFTKGKSGILLIPFHAYPEPESLIFKMGDLNEELAVNRTSNTSAIGRYTAKGWRPVDESNTRAVASKARNYYAILEISEVDGDDEGRANKLTVWNELGNSTYTFTIPVVENGPLGGGAISGIVIACIVAVVLLILAVLFCIRHRNGKK